ncbi:MAG TPA: transcriptional regulator NrdR [Chloroflexota bacterium]
MKCPYCGHNDSRVIDSRETETKTGGSIRRRRECTRCARRYTTYERMEHVGLSVVKKSGQREDYDREKLRRGVATACHRLPVPTDAVDNVVDDVEAELFRQGSAEVTSALIGELVMTKLRALNPIAYLRFASVYLSFTTMRDLQDAIDRVSLDPPSL